MKRLIPILPILALTLLVSQPLGAQEGARIVHQPAEGRPYSAAVQVGDTYWLSGKIGATDETRAMTEGRTAAETHNVMGQFRQLLGELDMDFGNVVRGVVYLAELDDYAEMNEAYGEYFGEGPPTRVTVEVSRIVGDAAIEISFIAVKN